MSGHIKTQVQLGDSNTPANNFVLTSQANDGSMKLARGNFNATTQDILTVDAAGKVAFPQNVQTLVDYTVSGRAVNTTYTNNTGQTIFVFVTLTSSNAGGTTYCSLGAPMSRNIWGTTANTATWPSFVMAAVPNGMTYLLQNSGGGTVGITNWLELR
jgi:hypothetical protein